MGQGSRSYKRPPARLVRVDPCVGESFRWWRQASGAMLAVLNRLPAIISSTWEVRKTTPSRPSGRLSGLSRIR